MVKTDFLKREKDSLVFKGYSMEIFLPEIYIERGISSISGNILSTFGLFMIKVKEKENSEGKIYNINIPMNLSINFDYKEIFEGEVNKVNDKYMKFHLFKNDNFLNSLFLKIDSSTVSNFINILNLGKLPNFINYNEIMALYKECLELNEVDLGVPSFFLEIMVSELCRVKGNTSKKFRTIATSKSKNTDFEYIGIKDIAHFGSTFSSTTFEDTNKSLILSVNRSKENKKEVESPIEKVMKY